jgi:hypothetical protein
MNVRQPRICVHCPNCDVVRVPASAVTVRHCVDTGSWDYWLQCPHCGGRSAGPSSWWLAVEAFAAGSAFEEWRLPAEMFEEHNGPPLNLLDLAELHLALAEPKWIDGLGRERGANHRRPPST